MRSVPDLVHNLSCASWGILDGSKHHPNRIFGRRFLKSTKPKKKERENSVLDENLYKLIFVENLYKLIDNRSC
jgi:hypothetical protein